MCGGTSPASPAGANAQGLSPRVRGNPPPRSAGAVAPGSIPACAGEPVFHRITSVSRSVYPRVCGGTSPASPAGANAQGLSPRVRGNPLCPGMGSPACRSIPACAGEPPVSAFPPCPVRVYPRVCGGTLRCRFLRGCGPGLSPRVRGNLQLPADACRVAGSIPACAGEPTGRMLLGKP